MNAYDELRKDRYAAIGVEGEESFVGRIVRVSDGLVEVQVLDPVLELPVFGKNVIYKLAEVEDFEFSYSLTDTFSDEEGNEISCFEHLYEFAVGWNKGYWR